MTKPTIAHPVFLGAIVVGVIVYFLWQRAEAQARAVATLPTGAGGTLFGPGIPTGTSTEGSPSGTTPTDLGTGSGTGPGDVITIGPITPNNLPQPSVSGNFPQASSS